MITFVIIYMVICLLILIYAYCELIVNENKVILGIWGIFFMPGLCIITTICYIYAIFANEIGRVVHINRMKGQRS